MEITELQHGSRIFHFRDPVCLHVGYSSLTNCYTATIPDLSLRGFDDCDSEAAMAMLRSEMAMAWDEYALEDDANLSPGGQEYKRHLLDLVTVEETGGTT